MIPVQGRVCDQFPSWYLAQPLPHRHAGFPLSSFPDLLILGRLSSHSFSRGHALREAGLVTGRTVLWVLPRPLQRTSQLGAPTCH